MSRGQWEQSKSDNIPRLTPLQVLLGVLAGQTRWRLSDLD